MASRNKSGRSIFGRPFFVPEVYDQTVELSRTEIATLSAAEKCDLIDALWQSLEESPEAVTCEQRVELDRRVAMYKQDPSRAIARGPLAQASVELS